ncbi:MAG: H-NS histone family protein [Paraburkholderia sp.]|uniref:H-NS histone family protein n=1 Tax=Paraburkholderia sp. TaxID=1926495 RepID=UPI001218A6CD|nr:H-NS histone family protein [Paraburkholderia sp.]TAM05675.1 MAG: H-NS histone family protein [Paraburkholderia sp.]
MKTYESVQAQIAKLEKQAQALRAREENAVLEELRGKIAEYGFTEKDLFGRKRRAPNGTVKTTGKSTVAPKYQDPKTGATWSGRGRAPLWIASAKNRDRFLIAAAE